VLRAHAQLLLLVAVGVAVLLLLLPVLLLGLAWQGGMVVRAQTQAGASA
jgi:hypothetical protein